MLAPAERVIKESGPFHRAVENVISSIDRSSVADFSRGGNNWWGSQMESSGLKADQYRSAAIARLSRFPAISGISLQNLIAHTAGIGDSAVFVFALDEIPVDCRFFKAAMFPFQWRVTPGSSKIVNPFRQRACMVSQSTKSSKASPNSASESCRD